MFAYCLNEKYGPDFRMAFHIVRIFLEFPFHNTFHLLIDIIRIIWDFFIITRGYIKRQFVTFASAEIVQHPVESQLQQHIFGTSGQSLHLNAGFLFFRQLADNQIHHIRITLNRTVMSVYFHRFPEHSQCTGKN